MNRGKKNIILVLVVGLILSVNYGAYADGQIKEYTAEMTDEITKEIINVDDQIHESKSVAEREEETAEVYDETVQETEDLLDDKDLDNDEIVDEVSETDEEIKNKEEELEQYEKNEQSSEQTVSTWNEFASAFNNQSIEKIILSENLTGPFDVSSLKARLRTIEIDGDNHEINTNENDEISASLFSLGEISDAQTFKLSNIMITHGHGHIIEAMDNKGAMWSVDSDSINVDMPKRNETTYFIKGENIDSIKFTKEINANINTGFLFAENASVEIIDANLKTKDGVFGKSILIKNSIVEIIDGSGGLNSSNEIYIKDASKVIVEAKHYGMDSDKVLIESSEVIMNIMNYGISASEILINNSKLDIKTKMNALESPQITINKSTGKIESLASVIVAASADLEKGVRVLLEQSNLTFNSNGNNSSPIISLGDYANATEAKLDIEGEGMNLDLISSNKKRDFSAISISSGAGDSGIHVSRNAEVNINVEDATAIYSKHKETGYIFVSQDACLNINQTRSKSTIVPVVIVEGDTEQRILVQYSAVFNIESANSNVPSVAVGDLGNLYMSITNNSRFRIHNPGDEIVNDSKAGYNNQVISKLYRDGVIVGKDNFDLEFSATGNSHVIFNADNGSVIDNVNLLKMELEGNASVSFEGKSATKNEAVINAKKVNFINSDSMYFNFLNHNETGGKFFHN